MDIEKNKKQQVATYGDIKLSRQNKSYIFNQIKVMNKQTAVEWLESEIKKIRNIIPKVLFEKAKQMEKEQIIAANEDCSTNELGEFLTGIQYYNETYGK